MEAINQLRIQLTEEVKSSLPEALQSSFPWVLAIGDWRLAIDL